jgi:hypothetical protein
MASFVKLPTIPSDASDRIVQRLVNREQICEITWKPSHYLEMTLSCGEKIRIHEDAYRLLGIAHADELHPEWEPPPKHSPAQFMSRRPDESKF